MTMQPTVWDVHMGRQVGTRPVEGGYVAINATPFGDLNSLPRDRASIKALIAERTPNAKRGAIPVYAGVWARFAHEM